MLHSILPPPQHFEYSRKPLHLIRQCHWSTHLCPQGLTTVTLCSATYLRSLQKLQRVQNMAARMITRTRKRDHITPVLKSLHWLPVEQRIQCKVLLMTFKAQRGFAPSYIRDLLRLKHGRRQLRSSTQTLLEVPNTLLKTAGDKTFAYQAATLWNHLPESIRSISRLSYLNSITTSHSIFNLYLVLFYLLIVSHPVYHIMFFLSHSSFSTLIFMYSASERHCRIYGAISLIPANRVQLGEK